MAKIGLSYRKIPQNFKRKKNIFLAKSWHFLIISIYWISKCYPLCFSFKTKNSQNGVKDLKSSNLLFVLIENFGVNFEFESNLSNFSYWTSRLFEISKTSSVDWFFAVWFRKSIPQNCGMVAVFAVYTAKKYTAPAL